MNKIKQRASTKYVPILKERYAPAYVTEINHSADLNKSLDIYLPKNTESRLNIHS